MMWGTGSEIRSGQQITIAIGPDRGSSISIAVLAETPTIRVFKSVAGIRREQARTLIEELQRLYSQPIPKKSPFMRAVKSRPWHCVFATPAPELTGESQTQHKATFQRGKAAPQDHTRRKRRDFLQKLRAK